MYPNKGRLLRESAVRDGGVVRGGYGNASEGSLWGPEKELLGMSGCLGRVCWQHSTRHHPSYCLHPSMYGGAPVLLGQRTRPAIAFLHDLEMITLVIGIYLDCLRVSDFFPLRTVRTDRRYDDRESYLGNV